MALDNIEIVDAGTEGPAGVTPEPVQHETVPEVDLSSVPETIREHVDTAKYSSDPDYKRAIEHGWKPKEVYMAEGGDEDYWTGPKGFNARYDDRQEKKALKQQISEVAKNTDVLLKTFSEEKQAAVQRALSDREAQLKLAIQDNDAARAVELQREIISMNQVQQPIQPPAVEPVSVLALRKANGFINPASPDFNAEVNAEFERIAKEKVIQYRKIYDRPLAHDEMKYLVEEAFDMVKNRTPVKPAPKPVQTPPAVSKPATSEKTAAPKLTAIQRQMYNALLSSNAGAAERYLKNLAT